MKSEAKAFRTWRLAFASVALVSCSNLTAGAADFTDTNWISMGTIPGVNGSVHAAAVDQTGNLYVGGLFTVVGDVPASSIAKWTGKSWSALASGMDNGVYAIAVSGNDVYAGGWFQTAGGHVANHIAKWNGSSWSALGLGLDAAVYALAVSGSNLYAGGLFNTATNSGGSTVNVSQIAKWDGNTWSALGMGMNGYVYSLAILGNDLYAAGQFQNAKNADGTFVDVNFIAKWNGITWSALGSGVFNTGYPWPSGGVSALAVSGNELYAAGSSTFAAGNSVSNVAKWNGSSWTTLGPGIPGAVFALAMSGSDLYVGGIFTNAGGVAANNVAKWNGNSWSPLGSGTSGTYGHVYALTASGSNLFAGGAFTIAGTDPANYLATWNGSNWAAMASATGLNDAMTAIAVSGSNIYMGGQFTFAGSTPASAIVQYNGGGWSALGQGISAPPGYSAYGDQIRALATSGNDLYVGGAFTMAGGNAANSIAKWNGSSWSAVGLGLDSRVDALAVSGSDLYVAGAFITATNSDGSLVTVNHVAKWNRTNWSALGPGMANSVFALAVSGTNLYAGGSFTTGSATNVAKWDGNSWSALGIGPDTIVTALAVIGTNLYAGGFFETAGGVPATNIARWDGSAWSALGAGLIDPGQPFGPGVLAMVSSGTDLFVGGRFTTAGGLTANYIAKWDGTHWTTLGSGMNYWVQALAFSGNDLYAGGYFTIAGGKLSTYVARASMPLPSLSLLRLGANVKVSWLSADTSGLTLEQADNLATPTIWITNASSLSDDGTNKSVTLPVTSPSQFFRLRRP